MTSDGRIETARAWCDRAVFGGEDDALDAAARELDAVEADLALLRGQVAHARFRRDQVVRETELELFERAARLYRGLGDARGEAEALFWAGCYHQTVRSDHTTAGPLFDRCLELAGDNRTRSYALRHLGIAEHAAGRLDAARERLTESTRLRREIGFPAGVAANLVGLAYLALAGGEAAHARELLDEAGELAGQSGAAAVLRTVEQARTQLPPGAPHTVAGSSFPREDTS